MYTPLFVKSNYSFLQSLVKIDDYIDMCKTYGIDNASLTDINMISTMYFYKKCKDNNIKPIIGLTTLYEDLEICLYARNHEGYLYLIQVNLNKSIIFDELDKNMDNVIIIIPFKSRELFAIFKKYNTFI